MSEVDMENRGVQFLVGASIIALIGGGVICLVSFWRLIPGWVGESVGMVAGIVSTPFFLEGSFFVMGLLAVIFVNNWRRNVGGDEFVEVDVSELPEEMRGEKQSVDVEGGK